MNEKIKAPRTESPRENPDAPETPPPTAHETEILDLLHNEADAHRGGKTTHELTQIHQDIERCECYPIFKKYVSGELPTLDRMFTCVKPLAAELDAEIEAEQQRVRSGDDPAVLHEMQSTRNLLLGREMQIRDAIQRYVHSVIRFNRLKKLSLGGARDMTKQFEEADRARRRAHNTLLNSLETYVGVVGDVRAGGGTYRNFTFESWKTGDDARTLHEHSTVLFATEVMRNRDFIRDWAIVADFHEQLHVLGDDEWLKKQNGDHSPE